MVLYPDEVYASHGDVKDQLPSGQGFFRPRLEAYLIFRYSTDKRTHPEQINKTINANKKTTSRTR
jgi:hypothetical protein